MGRQLETARLLLLPFQLEDAEATQRLFPHWEIVRFLASRVPWPYPADEALTYFRDVVLPAVEQGDEWHWSLRLKSRPGELIGIVSLRRQEGDNRRFWLGLPWQGRGLMQEEAEAVTDYWFDALGFPVLRTSTAAANVASRRISERSGMRVISTEERGYVSGKQLAEIREVTAEEWLRSRALQCL